MAEYIDCSLEDLPEVELNSPYITNLLELTVARRIGGLVVREATCQEVEQALLDSAVILGDSGHKAYDFDSSEDGNFHIDPYFPSIKSRGLEQLNIHYTYEGSVDADIIPVPDIFEDRTTQILPHLVEGNYSWPVDDSVDTRELAFKGYTAHLNEGDSLVFLDARNHHVFRSVIIPRLSVAKIYTAGLPSDYGQAA